MVKEIADKKNLISENTNREMDHDECAQFTQKTSLPLAGLLPKSCSLAVISVIGAPYVEHVIFRTP